jgi:hypothetical protein
MRVRRHFVLAGALAVAALPLASGQSTATSRPVSSRPLTAQNLPLEHQAAILSSLTPNISWQLEPLVSFRSTEIKFNLQTLMNTLRDSRHEGWVLAAYPDPKTSRPLIGAGFSLDLEAREHLQRDPLNATPFLEPSSAQLWEAAGLQPQQLNSMLEQYDRQLDAWKKAKFRRKVKTHSLFPEISEEDATKLLRISAIQAIHNARAYCRDFDQLSGPQQMALSQLVFQMGVNLEQFTQFLGAINTSPTYAVAASGAGDYLDPEYWHSVQTTLIQSDWARRYSTRAISVIAMLDPTYDNDPYQAEARVRGEVHPLVLHSHKRHHAAAVRTASASHKKSSAKSTRKS